MFFLVAARAPLIIPPASRVFGPPLGRDGFGGLKKCAGIVACVLRFPGMCRIDGTRTRTPFQWHAVMFWQAWPC